jgi:hypothetical protein
MQMSRLSLIGLSFLLISCNDFLNADPDRSQIVTKEIFNNEVTATAAVTGMYSNISAGIVFTGGPPSIHGLTSFASNEIENFGTDLDLLGFAHHELNARNSYLETVWSFLYNIIYDANDIIEGIHSSSALSDRTASQLEGEALFMRAFMYFYLVNLFGDVPLALDTDYKKNKARSRSLKDDVYESIESDLQRAQALLTDSYIAENKGRPNRAAATALLARVYLYRSSYAKAEEQATAIIESNGFQFTSDIKNTYLLGSSETIWQLLPVQPSYNTIEGNYFILTTAPNSTNSKSFLSESLVGHFEVGDLRSSNWVNSISTGSRSFYYPYKYKQKNIASGASYSEASVVFRLAEIYLIRAEARAQVGKITGANSALSDLNLVRKRAGLNGKTINDKQALMLAIEDERWSEFFTEYGHRWFDLKRTGRAIEVLGNGITPEDLLWPIPSAEFVKNPNLGKQNPGY